MRFLWAFGLVLLSGAAIAQDTQEERDVGLIVRLIEEKLSAVSRTVRIEGFQGALSSKATIKSLSVADQDGVWLVLEDVVLEWNRGALLRGAVDIEELSAAVIRIPRAPIAESTNSSAETSSFSLPELPVSIDIETLNVDRIELGAALMGQDIALRLMGDISLADGAGSATIQALRLGNQAGRFDIAGSYSNSTKFLDLDIDLTEAQGGIAAQLLGLPDEPALWMTLIGAGEIDDYTADMILSSDGVERVIGQIGTQSGADGARRVMAKLGGDVTQLFAPQYRVFFGTDLALEFLGQRQTDGRMVLDTFAIKTEAMDLKGTGAIGADGWPEQFELTGQLGNAAGGLVTLPVAGGQTSVRAMDLDLRFDAATGDAWQGAFEIAGFDRPGVMIEAINLMGGGVISRGDRSPAQITAIMNYGARGIALADIGLAQMVGPNATGAFSVTSIEGQNASLDDLTLRATGLFAQMSATLRENFEVGLEVRAEVAELGRLSRLIGLGLGGAGDIQMTGYLTPLEGGFDLKIDAETQDLSLGISQIDPLLTGQGTLFIQGARDESGTRIEQLTIGTSGLNANAQATLTSTGSTGEFAATVPDVSRSDPRIQGRASLTGTAVIDANGVGLFGVDVTAPGEVIGRVDATVGSDETKYATTLTAVLNGRDLSAYAGLVGQQIGGAARIEIAGNGMLAEQTFEANIDAATTSFRIGSPQADRVLRGAGQLAATIERDQDGALRVDELHVQTPNIALTGTYTAQANTTNADFDARLRDLGLFASEFSGPATAEGTARQSGGVWQIDTRFTAPQSIAGQVSGQIASDGDLNLTATGQIPLALANDALDPRRLNGIAQFDLAVNGPPKPGSLNGRITTTDARFSAPILSRALQDIDATITLANGGAMVAMTGDISTGGRISIDGTVGMDIPFRGDLAIALRDVLLRDPTLFETTARGDITVRGPLAGGATVAGVVTLGAVEVQVPSSGFGTIGNIPTITHIGASRAVQTTQTRAGLDVNATDNGGSGTRNQPYNLNLTINAPARIFIRGRGLDAELGGSLRVAGTTNQVIPQGQFDLVRGRFSILGQRFDLTQGSASLQGDFNPYLRLVASTQRDGETIDVTLEGPADAPEISFSSTSGLPQDEVLAQLLFGKTLDSISPLQAVQLASAVATLAGKGGGAMEGLRNSFGLDNLDLTTDDNGNAAVRAGAYISENVYTDITVGNDGTSEINLNLDLSPSLTVKGSFGSDGGTGIGIFFEQDY